MNETNNKKKYEQQEYQLVLEVIGKKRDKSYGGNWAGKPFYRLEVRVEKPDKYKSIVEIMAFKERIDNDEIWNEILNDDYIDKRKLVICSTYKKSFSLIRWTNREK